MAVNTNYSLTVASGIASVAPSTTTAPTGMAALTSPWVDLGAITTDGISENLSQSRTEFKRWGSIAPFQAVVTDEKHEFQVKFLESNASVLGLFYRVPTPTPDSTSHIISITDDTTGVRDVRAFVFDLVTGTNHIRFFVPNGEVTNVGNPKYTRDSLIEYDCTITAYPNSSGVAVSRQFLLDAVVAG